MKTGIDKINTEFNDSAKKQFASLYERFQNVAGHLDRKQDENVFQQLSSQYTDALRQQLGEIALGLIEKHKTFINDLPHLQYTLTKTIDYYANEFRQKSLNA